MGQAVLLSHLHTIPSIHLYWQIDEPSLVIVLSAKGIRANGYSLPIEISAHCKDIASKALPWTIVYTTLYSSVFVWHIFFLLFFFLVHIVPHYDFKVKRVSLEKKIPHTSMWGIHTRNKDEHTSNYRLVRLTLLLDILPMLKHLGFLAASGSCHQLLYGVSGLTWTSPIGRCPCR